MKKHGQNRFDVTKKIPGIDINTCPASGKPGIDINRRAAGVQIRDLTDTRSLEDFANRLDAARRGYRRFCIIVIVIVTATALASLAYAVWYILSHI